MGAGGGLRGEKGTFLIDNEDCNDYAVLLIHGYGVYSRLYDVKVPYDRHMTSTLSTLDTQQ